MLHQEVCSWAFYQMPVEGEQARKPSHFAPGESLGMLSSIMFTASDLTLVFPLTQQTSELQFHKEVKNPFGVMIDSE